MDPLQKVLYNLYKERENVSFNIFHLWEDEGLKDTLDRALIESVNTLCQEEDGIEKLWEGSILTEELRKKLFTLRMKYLLKKEKIDHIFNFLLFLAEKTLKLRIGKKPFIGIENSDGGGSFGGAYNSVNNKIIFYQNNFFLHAIPKMYAVILVHELSHHLYSFKGDKELVKTYLSEVKGLSGIEISLINALEDLRIDNIIMNVSPLFTDFYKEAYEHYYEKILVSLEEKVSKIDQLDLTNIEDKKELLSFLIHMLKAEYVGYVIKPEFFNNEDVRKFVEKWGLLCAKCKEAKDLLEVVRYVKEFVREEFADLLQDRERCSGEEVSDQRHRCNNGEKSEEQSLQDSSFEEQCQTSSCKRKESKDKKAGELQDPSFEEQSQTSSYESKESEGKGAGELEEDDKKSQGESYRDKHIEGLVDDLTEKARQFLESVEKSEEVKNESSMGSEGEEEGEESYEIDLESFSKDEYTEELLKELREIVERVKEEMPTSEIPQSSSENNLKKFSKGKLASLYLNSLEVSRNCSYFFRDLQPVNDDTLNKFYFEGAKLARTFTQLYERQKQMQESGQQIDLKKYVKLKYGFSKDTRIFKKHSLVEKVNYPVEVDIVVDTSGSMSAVAPQTNQILAFFMGIQDELIKKNVLTFNFYLVRCEESRNLILPLNFLRGKKGKYGLSAVHTLPKIKYNAGAEGVSAYFDSFYKIRGEKDYIIFVTDAHFVNAYDWEVIYKVKKTNKRPTLIGCHFFESQTPIMKEAFDRVYIFTEENLKRLTKAIFDEILQVNMGRNRGRKTQRNSQFWRQN